VSDFVLNETTGDIQVTAGKLFLTTGDDAVRQRLAMHLRLVAGEWFLDDQIGTDYYGSIFGKKSFVEINAELVRVILSTPGISGLAAPLSIDLNTNRVLSVEFQAVLDSGETDDFNFEIPVN
jgi:hypothetical protein